MPLDPKRTVAELRELQELTGDANGAQRVAWTDTWVEAQEWMAGKLDGIEMEFDEARNQWWTLPGDSERTLIIGGHLDSVPNGGWLDGALNVVAGSEVLRRIAEEGRPPVTVRLVSWADEEGARFGRSLFGSSAAAGSMADQDELRQRKDADGISLPDAIGAHGVDLDRATDARRQLANAAAYLELHIEQGPVLESMGLPLGVVLGVLRSPWASIQTTAPAPWTEAIPPSVPSAIEWSPPRTSGTSSLRDASATREATSSQAPRIASRYRARASPGSERSRSGAATFPRSRQATPSASTRSPSPA